MTSVVIAQGDDWVGLYIGGTLMMEGHHIEMETAFKVILNTMPKVVADDISTRWVDLDWLYEEGNLPNNIDDVKWS
jgi:hypothetical protein